MSSVHSYESEMETFENCVGHSRHKELLRKLEEKISTLVAGRRKHNCPGYRLVKTPIRQDVVSYVNGSHVEDPAPYSGLDYDFTSKLPFTMVCDHLPCRLDSEYEYFMCKLVARGLITQTNWRDARPKSRNHPLRNMLPATELIAQGYPAYCVRDADTPVECCGFLLYERELPGRVEELGDCRTVFSGTHWDPATLVPFTKPCDHVNCDPTAVARFALMRLYACSMIEGFDPDNNEQQDPFVYIVDQGTVDEMNRIDSTRLSLYALFYLNANNWELPVDSFIYQPESTNFNCDITLPLIPAAQLAPMHAAPPTPPPDAAQPAVAPAPAAAAAAIDPAQHSVRTWYRRVPNGPMMVHLKRTTRTGTHMYLNLMLGMESLNLGVQMFNFYLLADPYPNTLERARSAMQRIAAMIEAKAAAEGEHVIVPNNEPVNLSNPRTPPPPPPAVPGAPPRPMAGPSRIMPTTPSRPFPGSLVKGPFGPVEFFGSAPTPGTVMVPYRNATAVECYDRICRLQTEFQSMVLSCNAWKTAWAQLPASKVRPPMSRLDDEDAGGYKSRIYIFRLFQNLTWLIDNRGEWVPDADTGFTEGSYVDRLAARSRVDKLTGEMTYLMTQSKKWVVEDGAAYVIPSTVTERADARRDLGETLLSVDVVEGRSPPPPPPRDEEQGEPMRVGGPYSPVSEVDSDMECGQRF